MAAAATAQPYCLISWKKSLGDYSPMGKRRYASLDEALKAACRVDDVNGYMVLVDLASAFGRTA